MKLLFFLTTLLMGAIAFGACDLRVTSITTCDINGNAYAPKVGEHTYGLRVNWTVSGTANQNYAVKLEMADQVWEFGNVSARTPGSYYLYHMFPMPLDTQFPCRATLDPHNVSGETNKVNSTMPGQVIPALPTSAYLYFDYQFVNGWQQLRLTKNGVGTYSKVNIILGRPTVGTSQGFITGSGISGGTQLVTLPFNDPVYFIKYVNPTWTAISVEQTFRMRSSNFKMNTTKMLQSWAQYAFIPTDVKPYADPEARIQSTDPAISSFVFRHVPANYRSVYLPIDVARRLFLGVAQEMTLTNNTSVTAVQVLNAGRGDSMGFAMVYAAALRNVGIPARVVSGISLGSNKSRAWAEIWLPNTGWVPQDPATCDMYSPTGTYPFGFAVMLDLNQRAILSRATAHVADGGTFGPDWKGEFKAFRTTGTSTISSAMTCSLVSE